MINKKIIIELVFCIFTISSYAQKLTLEGKWKAINWIYISQVGRSLDKDEKRNMNEFINNLIIDFKSNGTISTNKQNELKFIENDTYKLYGKTIKFGKNNVVGKIFLIKKHCFLKLINNILFEIEKIEDYGNSKQVLEEFTTPKKLNYYKNKKIDDFLLIPYRYDKSIYPKFKDTDISKCGYSCLEDSFNENILNFIDFSMVSKDTTYLIEFIVDKTGEICNIKINSNKVNNQNNRILSNIEENIIHSILMFQGHLSPAEQNGITVNSKIKLTLRLISN